MMINFKQKIAKIAKGFQNRTSLSSSRPSRSSVKIIFTLLLFSVSALAEVAPVTVSVPKDIAWVGQRVQTRPADFLRAKFAYQQAAKTEDGE